LRVLYRIGIGGDSAVRIVAPGSGDVRATVAFARDTPGVRAYGGSAAALARPSSSSVNG